MAKERNNKPETAEEKQLREEFNRVYDMVGLPEHVWADHFHVQKWAINFWRRGVIRPRRILVRCEFKNWLYMVERLYNSGALKTKGAGKSKQNIYTLRNAKLIDYELRREAALRKQLHELWQAEYNKVRKQRYQARKAKK